MHRSSNHETGQALNCHLPLATTSRLCLIKHKVCVTPMLLLRLLGYESAAVDADLYFSQCNAASYLRSKPTTTTGSHHRRTCDLWPCYIAAKVAYRMASIGGTESPITLNGAEAAAAKFRQRSIMYQVGTRETKQAPAEACS